MKVQVHKKNGKREGCLICGKPIIYSEKSAVYACHMCKNQYESNAVCENGHYICDKCHSQAGQDFLILLRESAEKDPIKMFQAVTMLEEVHMHGPEHHSIVPCVLLTAYRNNGGLINLGTALEAAAKRGAQVPGGACGFLGACGAAVGAGIYASIVTGSTPLKAEVWSLPQIFTARCLEKIAELGGPRCCKRTSRIAIETAARLTREYLDVNMPTDELPCGYSDINAECIHAVCPYYGGSENV